MPNRIVHGGIIYLNSGDISSKKVGLRLACNDVHLSFFRTGFDLSSCLITTGTILPSLTSHSQSFATTVLSPLGTSVTCALSLLPSYPQNNLAFRWFASNRFLPIDKHPFTNLCSRPTSKY
jgi:hypothetical protein